MKCDETEREEAPLETTAQAEIDVWWASLAVSERTLHARNEYLSADELSRANAFHFERDRRRFLAARSTLRLILGAYLQIPARSLVFCYGPHGKPYVTDRVNPPLHFNLAHSHELVVCAVARDREVGIDIERLRPLDNCRSMAQIILSPREVREFHVLPKQEQERAFFRYWARKEAYVKATGDGMTAPLQEIDISDIDTVRPSITVEGKPGETQRWWLEDIDCPEGYTAAVAVAGGLSRVVHHCWPIVEVPRPSGQGVSEEERLV